MQGGQAPRGPAAAGAGKEQLPKGEEGFAKMWDAHPHNYQEGYEGGSSEQNKSSDQVREEEGLPAYLENTCAVRLSVMLNKMGYKITPAKTAAAGIARKPVYSAKSKEYYIVAAAEMWTYINKHFRKADVTFPANGRWKNQEEFDKAFREGDNPIEAIVASKKGIVAFDKIFGYGGTGHVDIFDGKRLSDAPDWYPCQRLQLWYVSV